MHIHELKSPAGSRKRRKIVGRGAGSGHGRTSGRGQKGQGSRSKGRMLVGTLEGGQMPLAKRLPKVGFRSKRPVINQVLDVEQLNQIEKGIVVNAAFLKSQGLIESARRPFKILGDGELNVPVVVEGGSVSETARGKILKAGGKITQAGETAAPDKTAKTVQGAPESKGKK